MASRKRVCYSLDLSFSSVEEKTMFLERIKSVREHFTPRGQLPIDNYGLVSAMLDVVESTSTPRPQSSRCTSVSKSFHRDGGELYIVHVYNTYFTCIIYNLLKFKVTKLHIGVYTGDVHSQDQAICNRVSSFWRSCGKPCVFVILWHSERNLGNHGILYCVTLCV